MKQPQQPPAVCQLSALALAASPFALRSGGSEKLSYLQSAPSWSVPELVLQSDGLILKVGPFPVPLLEDKEGA